MDPRSARRSIAAPKPRPARAITLAVPLIGLALAASALAQPGARGYVDMVYVPQTGKVLLFGGQASPNPPYPALGGTWWWDPADGSWTEVTGDPQPSPRSAGHLELHAPSGTVVHFGGGDTEGGGFNTLSETWVFDPIAETWTLLEFEGPTPQAEIGEMFAYHEAADVFVLFGGLTLNGFRYVNPTWHLDLDARAWTQVEPTTSPRGRNYNAFAYDPANEVLVMSGGVEGGQDETWTYDPRGPSWTLIERREGTSEVPYARFVWDPDAATLVRVGGLGPAAAPLWAFDVAANEWRELVPAGDAPQVSRHAATAVPGIGVVVYGGLPYGTGEFTDALWVLDVAAGTWEAR